MDAVGRLGLRLRGRLGLGSELELLVLRSLRPILGPVTTGGAAALTTTATAE